MLDKHKNIINNYFLTKHDDNYYFEVCGNELKIIIDNNTCVKNIDENSVNVWKIHEGNRDATIIINKINSLDVVAMIAIIDLNNNAYVTIKQTPTNMYISYNDDSIGYDINKLSSDLIINIIEGYLNKRRLLCNVNKNDIFKFIRVDIDDIFITIENNKEKYIHNLKHQLNNLNEKFVIDSEKIKEKIKTIEILE